MRQTDPRLKTALFRTYRSIATTEEGIQNLIALWKGQLVVEGLVVREADKTALAAQIALKLPMKSEEVLEQQLENITNPDRKRRFAFVAPALSANKEKRDQFFEQLKDPANRHYEPWVVEGLGYLHHPFRKEAGLEYLRPSLDLLEEIQLTGDIFFPKRWLVANLSGYQSPKAAAIVETYLGDQASLSPKLKNKVLQAADLLYRSSAQLEKSN